MNAPADVVMWHAIIPWVLVFLVSVAVILILYLLARSLWPKDGYDPPSELKAPKGKYRVMGLPLNGPMLPLGDYDTLRDAVVSADAHTLMICLVYNDAGLEVYNTISLRSNPELHRAIFGER